MFLADVGQAIERLRHLLVSGGRLAAALWHERSGFFATALAVAARELGVSPDEPAAFRSRLSDRGRLESLLREHGFADVRSEVTELTTPFDSADEYVDYMRDTGVTVQNLLAEQSPERREDVWTAIRTAIRADAEPGGHVVERAEALIVVGRRA